MTAESQLKMTDSADPLAELEAKLLKAVALFQQTQAERRVLRQEIERMSAETKEPIKRVEALEHEVQTLRRERDEVRTRIEKLVGQIEILTKADS